MTRIRVLGALMGQCVSVHPDASALFGPRWLVYWGERRMMTFSLENRAVEYAKSFLKAEGGTSHA